MNRSLPRLLGIVLVTLAGVSGCATGYLLESNVQSFSSLPAVPANPAYRFERLPSQQAFAFQDQVEAMADPALFKAGFRRNDAAPQFSVQVTARVQRALSPWTAPPGSWGLGFGGRGVGFGFAGPLSRMDPPWFQREVGIIVRELASNRVVYESHAASDGPWGDNAAVFPAMFEAALHGYPTVPGGPRRVNVNVGK